jgi:hypothetical protein
MNVSHIEGYMITVVWTHLCMFLNSNFTITMIKSWILLKPVLGGVDSHLHFPLLSISMNRFNQTEPATNLIVPFGRFFLQILFPFLFLTWSFRRCCCNDMRVQRHSRWPVKMKGKFKNIGILTLIFDLPSNYKMI